MPLIWEEREKHVTTELPLVKRDFRYEDCLTQDALYRRKHFKNKKEADFQLVGHKTKLLAENSTYFIDKADK